jgi:hypothetical protein
MDKLDPQQKITGTNSLTVGDFWAWAYSDILSNANRGVFAEFLVGSALGVLDTPRIEWNIADLYYREKKIEVKSAAYSQSWIQKAPSKIIFSIAETYGWDAATNTSQSELARFSDCYVFCLYKEIDVAKARENLLNVAYWDFFPISTWQVNTVFAKQKSLSLSRLTPYCKPVPYMELKNAIDAVLELQ